MNFAKHSVRLFIRSLIGMVYLVFFTVQLLFNFDTQGISHNPGKSERNKTAKYDNWEGKSHHPSVFRLNKRFQPSSTPALISFEIAPVRHFMTKPEPFYISPVFTPYAGLSPSLRAPPALPQF